MKLAIVGTVGVPANYGGFETLAEYLTQHLGYHYDITVYCSGINYKHKQKKYNNARLKYLPLDANGIQSVLYDIIAIFSALRFADTILILGVSGCIILPMVRLISNRTIIVNIDGLEWKRAKWGRLAKWFLKYSEKQAIKSADIIISDNRVIQEYVQNTYNKQSELITYGADHVIREKLTDEVLADFPFLSVRYAFKVCRIEPENNIHLILEAFSNYPDMNIVIVGNWDNNSYGKEMKEKYGFFPNVYLLNPIYDQGILNQIRSNCYMYIHGHSAGGTNPSLVEAMFLGLPVLCYDIGYNKETTHKQALYFKVVADLILLLRNLKGEELNLLAIKMKRIAHKHYLWENISKSYSDLIHL